MNHPSDSKMTVGSLFSGIGGIDYGLEMTGGFKVLWQVEIDPYCQQILKQHWPEAVVYGDVRKIRGSEVAPVDVLAGGFPCQDVSTAGKRAGIKEGTRSGLWAEYARLIGEIKPRWVIIENVPGLLSIDSGRGMGKVLYDLSVRGYDAEWDCISAASVGALHRRDRIFIVAHARHLGGRNGFGGRPGGDGKWGMDHGAGAPEAAEAAGPGKASTALADSYDDGRQGQGIHIRPGRQDQTSSIVGRPGQDVPDPNGILLHRSGTPRTGRPEPTDGHPLVSDPCRAGLEGQRPEYRLFPEGGPCPRIASGGWWAVEPDVGRVANGVPARVDRLRALGNAVVPQVAEYLGNLILEAERSVSA